MGRVYNVLIDMCIQCQILTIAQGNKNEIIIIVFIFLHFVFYQNFVYFFNSKLSIIFVSNIIIIQKIVYRAQCLYMHLYIYIYSI